MNQVAFVTVGCRLNQFETELMREAAEVLGWDADAECDTADVCIVNTCTVTARSDSRSRQAIRRIARSNPGAVLIATGCYAQRRPQELAAISGVDAVIGNAEKQEIAKYLSLEKRAEPLVSTTLTPDAADVPRSGRLHGLGDYTRAFVKIQDGCDNRCTYCAVPAARGPSRSKSPGIVRREIETLAARGYREIVLTGVHLGSYGRDLSPGSCLAALIEALATVEGLARVRLSSVEPTDLDDRLIDLLADRSSKLCPHVHVPLQSGDDTVLGLMGRPYTAAGYRALLEKVASRVPYCGIGADVMVGFPGETLEAFRSTFELVKNLPLTYLHAFAFSSRDGTRAAGLGGQIDPGEKRRRSCEIRGLGSDKSRAFRRSLVGRTLEALVLRTTVRGHATGISGNYVKVFFDGKLARNALASGRVTAICPGGVAASACGEC
jgi:threonylcarbamoyladenosine tRNA methylthiotransferase MtaB